jgi:hypothetical protein
MKTNPSFLKKLSLALLVVLTSASLHAQVAVELKSYLDQGKASSDAAVSAQATKLENLIYEIHPSVNIREGVLSTYADAPYLCVDTDVPSINQLEEANPLFSQVELITIRINSADDLKLVLDLALLKGFSNLKYVYFLCSVDCTPEQIINLIKAMDTNIQFFYLISIPS